MKKSYHSIVVPIVDAMTALRNCALCSGADSPPYVAAIAMVVLRFLAPQVLDCPRPVAIDRLVPASFRERDRLPQIFAQRRRAPRGSSVARRRRQLINARQ